MRGSVIPSGERPRLWRSVLRPYQVAAVATALVASFGFLIVGEPLLALLLLLVAVAEGAWMMVRVRPELRRNKTTAMKSKTGIGIAAAAFFVITILLTIDRFTG